MTTVCLLIAIATSKDRHLNQLDVNNAFLHVYLNEEVCMSLPQGLQTKKPNPVCHLKKSLYGLNQASRQWYTKLANYLQNIGFVQSSSDHSLFIKKTNSCFMALDVYIDDIILAGDDAYHMDEGKKLLDEKIE